MKDIFKCLNCGLQKTDSSADNTAICSDCGGDYRACVECEKEFICETDLSLCESCINKFDLNKLWKMHDNNKIDALDFNDNKKIRERFRK